MKNPNCDNDKCRVPHSEVRVLPTGGRGDNQSNLILCQACFEHEIRFRVQRNRELAKDCRFDLPSWESLEIYGEVKA